MANTRRVFRVAEKIREILATALIHSGDSRLQFATVTAVNVSSDLRNAKVYWNHFEGSKRRGEIEEALEEANGGLRKELASRLQTKFVPELRFFYDDTYDTAVKVHSLMESMRGEEPGGEEPSKNLTKTRGEGGQE